MATAIGALFVDLQANSAAFSADMGRASAAVRSSQAKINRNLARIDRGFDRVRRSMRRFIGLAAAGLAVRGIIRAADSYTLLSDRIRAATGAGGDFEKTFQAIFAISQRTRTELASNVALFQRMAIGAREFGATDQQILAVTEAVDQLGIIGGASLTALRMGTTQFSQAMTSGIVRAEEFNSILENIPLVAQRIARGMGVTTGELRKLVIDGKVLSQDVFASLLSQTGEISDDFAEVSVTLTSAWDNLGRSIAQAVGRMNEATGLTAALAGGVENTRKEFDLLTGNVTGTAAELLRAELNVIRITNSVKVLRDEIARIDRSFLPDFIENRSGTLESLIAQQAEFLRLEARSFGLRKTTPADLPGAGAADPAARTDKQTAAIRRLLTAIDRETQATDTKLALLNETAVSIARVNAEQRVRNKLADIGATLTGAEADELTRYLDGLEAAAARLARAREEQEKLREELDKIAEARRRSEQNAATAARVITSGLEQMILSARNAGDAFRALGQVILQVILRALVLNKIQAGLTALFTGAAVGGVSPTGADVAGTPFRHGGSFTVGGRAGTDANLVPLALTRGERVTVETRAQQRAGRGGDTFFVDLRGATVEAVQRLEALVAQLDATLELRAVGAVVDAGRRGIL